MKEMQLFYFRAVNSKPCIWKPKLATTMYITRFSRITWQQTEFMSLKKANKNPEFFLIKSFLIFTDFYVAFNFNVF